MYCKNCGKQMPDGAQFCDGCGARQVDGGYVTYTNGREPKPSVGFIDAIKMFFTKYADFNTRSRRSEYWWAALFCALAGMVASAILKDYAWLWTLAILVPSIALGVRRLHDIGKPKTRRFEAGGKVSFHHHDAVGAKMTRKRLKALRYEHHLVEDVSELVNMHLRFHGYVDEPWTDSAVRRYVKDAGHLYERLNRLTRADATTQNKRKAMIFSQAMDEMEERVRELKKKEDFDAIRPDLDGNEIMELLGLEPGPMIGRAYKHMLEYRLDNGPVDHDVAVEELKRWYAEIQ